MIKSIAKICLSIALISALYTGANAQFVARPYSNNLFSVGYASAFVGGLFDGFYPYSQLKTHGDFGLGAPDKVDGELLMLDGKLYQSRANGQTIAINDTAKTPYAVVCFFSAEKTFKPAGQLNKAALFHYLDSVLTNRNGMYAIHIKGSFSYIKTRAFPPVSQKPYLPLAAMLDRQHFFEYRAVSGDLVGYKLPAYLDGQFISGYHFHFLSDDKANGGHLIDITTDNIIIEIDELKNYTIDLPQTADFKNFDFKKDRSQEIKRVETGVKQ
jgi:acetolactate decarboxylase